MNHKRFLLLLLVLALVLVAPIHTFADPPDDQCPSPFSSDGHHSYSQSRQEATCTDAGSITWVCSDCGKVYTETIPALGHDYVERVDKAATCTEAGHAYWVCSRCSDMQEITLPATGHAWDNGAVTQAPTCAAEGVRTFTCTRCGATRTEAIAKTADHTPVSVPGKAATCTEAGLTDGSKCSICGAVLMAQQTIPAKGHSWDGGRVTQEATCTAEGIKTFTCSNCGATRTDTFPAKGHTPAAVPAKAATCTEPGLTEGSQCSACGTILKAQETIPAKGHAWDGGVITTEPQGFTPGVRTFTCTVCGATKTEAVDSTLSVFSGMNIPSCFGFLLSNDPVPENLLHIVQQPQGGFIPRGGYTELTVEAAGGEGEYTYEWWYAPELPMVGASALTDFLTGFYGDSVATVSQAKDKTGPLAAQLLEAWKKQNGIPGTVDHTVTTTEEQTAASTDAQLLQVGVFSPLAEIVGEASFVSAHKAGTYWCVVYDEAGHHATSDKVQMQYGLYIAVEPESKNIYGLSSVTLTCRAAGGSGPEQQSYTWYDAEGKVVSDEASFSTDQIGVYHCLVVDFGTNETVESFDAQVYSEEWDLRPTITVQPESIELEYREDGQYSWSLTCQAQAFDGSTEDLQYQCSGKTDTGWTPIGAGETLNKSYDHGTFRCTVTDKRNGQYVSSNEVKISIEFKFTTSRIVGFDYDANSYLLEYIFVGGVAPYTVEIFTILPGKHEEVLKRYKNITDTRILAEARYSYQYVTADPYQKEIVKAFYYAFATDSLGQTCISSILPY